MIRIAQEETGTSNPTVGGFIWPTTAIFVRDMDSGVAKEVKTPEQARDAANSMSSTSGAKVYRGSLPAVWRQALEDIARS